MSHLPGEDFGPILPGDAASDYERYLRTDELLSLQKPAEDRIHPDELLFQTVHQSSELWLKFGCAEVEQACQLIDADDLPEAARLLRRAVRCLIYVTDALEMLSELDPWDYDRIRMALGHGSGFDSPGFRHVARVSMRAGGAFDRALERERIDLIELYRARRDHPALYDVAERLTDWDERIFIWRHRHYSVVTRAIGEETIGTQGQPVQVLTKLMNQRHLPRLWEVRCRLVELFESERNA